MADESRVETTHENVQNMTIMPARVLVCSTVADGNDGDGEGGIGDGFDQLWLVMMAITCKGHEVVGALPGHELSLQLIPPSTAVQHRPRHLPNENPFDMKDF